MIVISLAREHIIISTKSLVPTLAQSMVHQVCTLPSGLLTPSLFILSEIFNHWDATATPMQTLYTSGVWEVFVPNLGLNELYKFAIQAKNGEIIFKADPYARAAEYRPGTASKTTIEPKSLVWSDDKWMTQRAKSRNPPPATEYL